jgi:hypothetical protein
VADRVVQFAGDPQPLFGDRLLGEQVGPFLEPLQI